MILLKNLVKTWLILLVVLTLVNCTTNDHTRTNVNIQESQIKSIPEPINDGKHVAKIKVVDNNICFQDVKEALTYEKILNQRDYLLSYSSMCYDINNEYINVIKIQEKELSKMGELLSTKDDMIELKNDQIQKERYIHFTVEGTLLLLLILL